MSSSSRLFRSPDRMAYSNLPPELWAHIFRCLSTVDELTDSSQDAWANIVTADPKHSYIPSPTVIECSEAKRALGLVSTGFYDISRPVALESVALQNLGSLRYFAGQIARRPEFARVVARCTKRIVFNMTISHDEEQQFLKDSEFILRSSQNLTCLLLPLRAGAWTDQLLADVICYHCPLLEVFRFPRRPLHPDLPSIRFSAGLRVLDVQHHGVPLTRGASVSGSYDLPLLHTLMGPKDILCSYFFETQLPSLRTLVFNRESQQYVTTNRYLQFFHNHGRNIENLDISGDGHSFTFGISEFLSNVRQLVVGDSEGQAIWAAWPNVQKLGIRGRVGGNTAEVARHMLDEIVSQRIGKYRSLTTIRILSDDATRFLREQMNRETEDRVTRLRLWGINVEDERGDLLIPPPS